MAVSIVRLQGAALEARLDDVARLRCAVFREWPYLYDGDADYERRYLSALAEGDGTIVAAMDGEETVGVATAMPLAEEHEAFAAPFAAAGLDVTDWFYLAESVLLPLYRGQGIGVRFFSEREAVARAGGFDHACFCAVERPPDHSARPENYVPLDGFWRRRGYEPMDVTARFPWREVGDDAERDHVMRFWSRRL